LPAVTAEPDDTRSSGGCSGEPWCVTFVCRARWRRARSAWATRPRWLVW